MPEDNVTNLIQALSLKRRQFQELGAQLRRSARPTIVCFVDLADSTAIKNNVPAEEWLGYIFEFLNATAKHASTAGGKIIKRIGDEIMISFADVKAAEAFLNGLSTDKNLDASIYKVAIDFGEAYYLKFAKGLENDPYGTVVDRCARIAKLANPGVILASQAYTRQLYNGPYVSAGKFQLKGIPEAEEVFFRQPSVGETSYLKPLLDALNSTTGKIDSYTSTWRQFNGNYLASFGKGDARPFLARALLNLPRLADTPEELDRKFPFILTDEIISKHFRGHYIEWDVVFDKYEIKSKEIQVQVKLPGAKRYDSAWIEVAPSMLDIIKQFEPAQRLRLRGVILNVFYNTFSINYADFETLQPSNGTSASKIKNAIFKSDPILTAPKQSNVVTERQKEQSWWQRLIS